MRNARTLPLDHGNEAHASSNVAWFRYVLLIGLAVGLEGGGPGQADAVRLERRHVEAGLKAARRSASREASSHFEQALGEHQRCLDLFPEASALAEGLGDRRRLARAATLAWRALPFLGQYPGGD